MHSYAHMDSLEIVKAEMLVGDNVTVLADWAGAVVVEEIDPFDKEGKFPGLNVQCKDEVKRASLGDYIVKHEDHSFSVHKSLEFLRNYKQQGT